MIEAAQRVILTGGVTWMLAVIGLQEFDPTNPLLNYAVLGVMFLLVLFGMLVPKWALDRERGISNTLLANNTTLAEATKRMADAWETETKARRGAR